MSNRKRGRRSKKQGDNWEETIHVQNDMLYSAGRAVVHKSHEPLRMIRPMKGGRVLAAFCQKAMPDYVGTLMEGGRSVRFEAKSTTVRTRFPFSLVKDHQVEDLATQRQFGGVSFVYVAHIAKPGESYRTPNYYVLPVSEEGVIAGVTGRKSFPFPDDREDSPFWVRPTESWLDAWERLEAEGH